MKKRILRLPGFHGSSASSGSSGVSAGLLAMALWGATIVAPFACSTTPSQPRGDRVVDDTHPATSSTATSQEDSAPPPPSDGGSYDARSYTVPDGYSPTAVCDKCSCASNDGGFCFGGGTGKTDLAGECIVPRGDAGDGSVPSSALLVGCNPIPAACEPNPDCACLIDALHVALPCYTVCSTKGGLRIYCPNP